ncbi:MAG: YceI family protein [Rhodospirillales bacterium]
MIRRFIFAAALMFAAAPPAAAADYVIDFEGAHASINFRVQHLGYSWLTGRFDKFSGAFSFDAAKPEAASIAVDIDTASVSSNHARRDNHLRSPDFLDVKKYPKASFKSTSVKVTGAKTGQMTGDLTLHGVTKPIVIDVEFIGEGSDPWGGHRAGFSGKTSFTMADFGIDYDLGPASRTVEMDLHVEGVRR